jgi:hypothetical protein
MPSLNLRSSIGSGVTYKFFLIVQLVLFSLMLLLWFVIQNAGLVDTNLNYIFGFFLAFVPLSGFFAGLFVSKQWGYWSSKVGRSILLIALGLFFWSLGTFIFAYYNLIGHVEVPYPSTADFAYVSLYLFYILGALNLMRATGASASLKSWRGKLVIITIPLLVFVTTYNWMMGGAFDLSEGLSWVFLMDIFYPLGDVLMLSLIISIMFLSAKYLGGVYRLSIYLLFSGFVAEFIADFGFTVTTYNETFYVASWVDLVFLVSTTLVSLALITFSPERLKLRRNNG